MNLGEVLNKIPRPPVSLPQMPSIGSLGLGGGHKDLSQLGRAPLNMTQVRKSKSHLETHCM
ncbi:unnamed protein product [Protopolystoma xenopodis]|uniref:Uncharacterized protein n=1 Tax=Protopolystoma xenopodis TaxID=117903 RepID=A0A3S5CPN7_9PLAT|nr:unnamed protein product [Protopolystoma xenopodis]